LDVSSVIRNPKESEKGSANQDRKFNWLPNNNKLAESVAKEAERAAYLMLAGYIIPSTVASRGNAKACDVIATRVICVDLDTGDIKAKRDWLVSFLGLPSLEVVSGGVTPGGQSKLHLYWILSERAAGADVGEVANLRHDIALKVGGDCSFQSPHQPIRLPGSIYRKNGAVKLVTLLEERPTNYALCELREKILAMPTLPYEERGDPQPKSHNAGNGKSKPSAAELLDGRKIREGGVDGITRHDALTIVIGHFIALQRAGKLSLAEALVRSLAFNAASLVPPFPEEKVRRDFDALWRRDQQHNQQDGARTRNGAFVEIEDEFATATTDSALARAFAERHKDALRHVAFWGRWMHFDGNCWAVDETKHALDLVHDHCREAASEHGAKIIADLRLKPKITERDAAELTAKKVAHIVAAKKVTAVHSLAQADRRLAAASTIWDADPDVLNEGGD
jgi:putative DNA primase/helicase